MLRKVFSYTFGLLMVIMVSGCAAGVSSGSHGSGVGVGAGVSVGY